MGGGRTPRWKGELPGASNCCRLHVHLTSRHGPRGHLDRASSGPGSGRLPSSGQGLGSLPLASPLPSHPRPPVSSSSQFPGSRSGRRSDRPSLRPSHLSDGPIGRRGGHGRGSLRRFLTSSRLSTGPKLLSRSLTTALENRKSLPDAASLSPVACRSSRSLGSPSVGTLARIDSRPKGSPRYPRSFPTALSPTPIRRARSDPTVGGR